MKRFGKAISCLLAVLLLTAVLALPASAASDAEVGEDRYLFSDSLKVENTVTGDLLAFALEMDVRGTVLGSIRAFASDLRLQGEVGRNVTVAGLTVQCDGAFSANDVMIAGETVVFAGVCRDLRVEADTVYLAGKVTGEFYCEADRVVLIDGAEFGSAQILSPSEPVVASSLSDSTGRPLAGSAYEGRVAFEKQPGPVVDVLQSLAVSLLSGLVLTLFCALLFAKRSDRVAGMLKARPVAFLLRGFGPLLLLPFAGVVLLLLGYTMSVGAVLLLAYILVLAASKAVTALLLARVLLPRWNAIPASLLLSAGLSVLGVIPVLGTVSSLLCALIALGVLIELVRPRREPIVLQNPEMDFRV